MNNNKNTGKDYVNSKKINIDVKNQSQVEKYNKKVNEENNKKKEDYLEIKSMEIYCEVLNKISQVENKNFQILEKEHKKDSGKETRRIEKEKYDNNFMKLLKDINGKIELILLKIKDYNNVPINLKDQIIKDSNFFLVIFKKAINENDYIFIESKPISDQLLLIHKQFINIEKELINLNKGGCYITCCDAGSKGRIKACLDYFLIRKDFIKMIFELQPRMKTEIVQKSVIVKPQPLVLDEELVIFIKESLSIEFPIFDDKIKLITEKIKTAAPAPKKEYIREDKSNFMIAQEYFFGIGVEQNYHEAKNYYIESQNDGNDEASNCLGKMYLFGKGIKKDYEKAFGNFKRSADNKNKDGLYYIGYMHEKKLIKGYNGSNNLLEARYKYEEAANLGQSDALTDLAIFHENGLAGYPINYNKALENYNEAVSCNNPRAMNNLASLYLKLQDLEKFQGTNEKNCFELYERSMELGYTKAYTNLGVCYLKGIYVSKDIINAKKLFKEASERNDPDAKFYLAYYKLKEGNIYGNEEVYFDAIELLRSCLIYDKNHSDALYYMGYLYENGLGCEQDYKISFNYFNKSVEASKNQNAKALFKLGNMLYTGLGVGYGDKEKSVNYIKLSADLGDKDAMNLLAIFLEEGEIVNKDYQLAKEYYLKSGELGNLDAKFNLALLFINNKVTKDSSDPIPENLIIESAQKGNERAKEYLNSNEGINIKNFENMNKMHNKPNYIVQSLVNNYNNNTSSSIVKPVSTGLNNKGLPSIIR